MASLNFEIPLSMSKLENVILVGPMGAGKTTIGRQLADALSLQFKDSDHEIINRTGASIPLIFDIEGEDGFRRREHDAIADLTAERGLVLATGGGAVIRPENRSLLKERGMVIYLHASIDQLLRRVGRDRNRPLLQTEDPRGKLLELMAERDPMYREVADMVVYTDDRSVRSTIKEILLRLEDAGLVGAT